LSVERPATGRRGTWHAGDRGGKAAAERPATATSGAKRLAGTAGRQVFANSHLGRPAHYFVMSGVSGTPVLGGQEAVDNGPGNRFELRWATAGELDGLNLRPAEIRPLLAALLAGA
jgi:hypothetical protein